jgi:hypothetical protein
MNDGITLPVEPEIARHTEERVHGRAGAAHVGLGVAACARDEVEPRAEALVDCLLRAERELADVEHLPFIGGETRDGPAGAGPAAHAGIVGAELRVDGL